MELITSENEKHNNRARLIGIFIEKFHSRTFPRF